MPGVPGGPSDMVTAVVTATPDVFGGNSVTPGLRGQQCPGLGPVVTRAWPHPGARCQWSEGSSGEHAHRVCCSDHAECASRGARARCHCLSTHLSGSAGGQPVTGA